MSNISKINFFKKASDNEINKYFDKLGKIALHKGGKYNKMYIDDISLLNCNRQNGGLIDCMFGKIGEGSKCYSGKIGEGSNCSDQKWQKLQNDLNIINKNKKPIPSSNNNNGNNDNIGNTGNTGKTGNKPPEQNPNMNKAFSQ